MELILIESPKKKKLNQRKNKTVKDQTKFCTASISTNILQQPRPHFRQ